VGQEASLKPVTASCSPRHADVTRAISNSDRYFT
jgi:hypothetical protein